MRFNLSVPVLFTVALLVSTSAALHAQVTTATLYGVVRDASAAPVAEPLPVVEEPLPVVDEPLPVVEETSPVVEDPSTESSTAVASDSTTHAPARALASAAYKTMSSGLDGGGGGVVLPAVVNE